MSPWFYVLRYVLVVAHIHSEPNDIGVGAELTRIYSMDRIFHSVVLYTLENNSLTGYVTLILCATIYSIIMIPSAAAIISMVCVSNVAECHIPLPRLTTSDFSG